MKKDQKVIRNLLIGLFVALFVVGLCIFGWTLINKYYNNSENYNNNFDFSLIDNYKKLNSYYKENPVITIIYASTSKNMTKYAKNVASVLQQSVKVDRIIFALPLNEETRNTFRDLPKWMYKMGIPLPMIKSKNNLNKDSAILTHVNLFKVGNHIGIVLFENINYKPDYIKKLLEFYEKHEERNIVHKNKSILFKPENFISSKLVENIVLEKNKPVKYIEN